jgi:hypothetical protein
MSKRCAASRFLLLQGFDARKNTTKASAKERELGKGGERLRQKKSYFSRVFVRMNDDFSVEKQPLI